MNKMNKKIFLSSLALFGAFGIVSAQTTPKVAELDIIIRDFEVTHPDFENFSQEASVNLNGSWVYPGFRDDANWSAKRADNVTWGCGNKDNPTLGVQLGTDGWPINSAVFQNLSTLPPYLKMKVSSGVPVKYGECNGGKWRGYSHEASCSMMWEDPVYVTPGMVQTYLQFPVAGEDMMYEPVIVKNRNACDNQYFEQWFTGNTKRTNTVLQLPEVPNQINIYEVDYNWNNGGYFPLDVVDAANNWGGSLEGSDQYGPQSLSIFCPPYQYQYASTQADYTGANTAGLCNAWLANGGPKVPGAAMAAAQANGALGSRHLRNYGFTMMGYAKFKYKKGAGEVFEFAGDDDMWIFVDGVLAVDLGGTHLAAPGKADMDFLSANGHGCQAGEPLSGNVGAGENCDRDVDGTWKDGSWHHLHFFYADRQTDGSNMKIRSSLSELAPSRYGQPMIGEATVTPVEGQWVTNLILNTPLSDQTVAAIQSSGATGGVPVVVRRPITTTDAAGNVTIVGYETFVYKVDSFEFGADKGADGVIYKMTGLLYPVSPDGTIDWSNGTIPQSGDEMSFNYPVSDPTVEGYIKGVTDNPWILANPITATSGLSTAGPTWGTSQLKASIAENFDVVDKTIDRPDFNVEGMLNASGMSAGDELPKNATGELLVSVLPLEAGEFAMGVDGWLNQISPDGKKTNQDYYAAAEQGNPLQDGSVIAGDRNGAPISVKSRSNKAYCYADDKGVESCASISFWVSRPFQVNVRVFDHLGHFISQYTEEMSSAEMEALARSSGKQETSGTCANKPTFSGALVSVKLYPISQNGRKVASGPYIYQVSLIKESWAMPADGSGKPYCFYYAGGSSPIGEEAYERSSFSKTLGYRRVTK
jgi:fibro-slime domain-containing protein